MGQSEAIKLLVRLPRDVKAWLAAEALRNFSSQGSEVVRAVRAAMEKAEKHEE